jgi:TRAP-type C4-dicarboxylate transport system substrate-binding protein
MSVPTGALAFQWSAQARYMTDLHLSYLSACVLVSNRFFDELPYGARQQLRAGVARLQARWEQLAREIDRQLLEGLFEKQGIRSVPVSEAFRAEFLEATRAAREQNKQLVPEALIGRVLGLLADFRARHVR